MLWVPSCSNSHYTHHCTKYIYIPCIILYLHQSPLVSLGFGVGWTYWVLLGTSKILFLVLPPVGQVFDEFLLDKSGVEEAKTSDTVKLVGHGQYISLLIFCCYYYYYSYFFCSINLQLLAFQLWTRYERRETFSKPPVGKELGRKDLVSL